MKRLVSLLLVAVMCFSLTMPVFAATTGYSKVTLTVEGESSEVLSVSIPVEIALSMDKHGNVTAPTNLKIINLDSERAVEVIAIKAVGQDGWQTASFDDNFAAKADNTKEFSFMFNNDKMNANGEFVLTDGNWNIGADSQLPLNIQAKIPMQTHASSSQIAQVGFTIELSDDASSNPSIICPNCSVSVNNTNAHLMDCGHYSCENDNKNHTSASCGSSNHYNCDGIDHSTCSICNNPKCEGSHGDDVCSPMTTLSVDYTNGLMLPGSVNTATFNWETNVENNVLTNVTSSNPDVAEVSVISTFGLGDVVDGQQSVAVEAKALGTTVITGTLSSGETASFTVNVSELSDTEEPSGEVETPEDLEAGDTLNPEDIVVTIPVTNPDGTSGEVTVTPEEIPETELVEGDNQITVEVDVNGVTITIIINIYVDVPNPSNGLIQTVAEAKAAGWTFASYENGLQITAFENVNFVSVINIPEQIGEFKVLSIGNNVFKDQSNLKTITMPDTIKHIGDYAFDGCTNLETLLIANNPIEVGHKAFADCNSLQSIKFEKGSTFCEEYPYAFYDYPGHVYIYFSEDNLDSSHSNYTLSGTSTTTFSAIIDIASIHRNYFQGQRNLISLTIRSSVTYIDYWALASCYNLETIYYEGTEEEWNAIGKGGSWDQQAGLWTEAGTYEIVFNYNLDTTE